MIEKQVYDSSQQKNQQTEPVAYMFRGGNTGRQSVFPPFCFSVCGPDDFQALTTKEEIL